MPETCWGPVCEWIHIVAQWLKIHAIPLAPLATPLVAMLAGAIALYSIHVTRVTARRRAAIDFFLKTDMDKGMAEIYKAFRDSLAVWEVHAAANRPVEEFIKSPDGKLTDDYRNINTYLNIHELVAVGIRNKVFDHTVCYHFWSDALVGHTERTKALIEHEVSTEGGAAAYWELRNLSSKWKKRLLAWQAKQTKKAVR
ncbi:DUF4760 domain-containing protein [Bradyrhizobium sp. 2S1]|uniref:DUF4760 domain-containing protein n=1 Tax=Bradyrhizobium sp. 2S1 TaxID=1404429 RepID=UPI00159545F5